ncbi:MAG: 5'-methylthioadenosine/S-adenosylhomocysteine nucleosidase [Actinomyces sp.]|uniref:5'-methylthioadenosine/S-adenosylhomocysteine nucleosidase n=1 Tax=Actinomyces sp. TaxID=29317 RepID=UPI0026DBB216|nr:5'-methylthioadenosine/S-adenosylhomocysteine nucleosidase [Actinomyces sp.]MDO4242760.1 5'-methylthioadenosine/S-adenosylhomocysteine nucleosidase [Actinomyces sp.]
MSPHTDARSVAALVSVAMDEEARPFLEALPPARRQNPPALAGGAEAWSLGLPDPATVSGTSVTAAPRELILVRTGIGLVAAASALATVLARVRPGLVVSAGTTGGLGRQVAVGDVCASTTLALTDADATAFGYALGQTPGQPERFEADAAALERLSRLGAGALQAATPSSARARLHTGLMLAGNSFVTAANVADTRERFPAALSTDMESTALAQVCAAAGIPFIAVRGVSDLCGPEAGQDFHIGAAEAAARSAAVVLALLAAS